MVNRLMQLNRPMQPGMFVKKENRFPHVLLWTPNDPYYTGGRYYNYQVAVTLARIGCLVTIRTNRKPIFKDDFALYGVDHNIKWLTRDPEVTDGLFDLVIATPFMESLDAQRYAEANGIPCASIVYETPQWVWEYEPDNTWYAGEQMERQLEAAQKSDFIIAISDMCKQYAHKWCGIPNDRILVLPPAINNAVADSIEPTSVPKDRPLVVFTGRIVDRKNPGKFLKMCLDMDEPFDIVVIGGNPNIDGLYSNGNEKHTVTWHRDVNDTKKFQLIADADVVVVPSKFEGYGIVPGEALYMGKPCVVFDLPILREVYGSELIYAKWMDWEDLADKLVMALEIPYYTKRVTKHRDSGRYHRFTMDAQSERAINLDCLPFKYRDLDDIKFSFCMIAFNCADFVQAALESVYDEAHEIIIVEGAIDYFSDEATADGLSTDGTHELILDFPDPESKIKYSCGRFPTKLEMRQKTVEQITGTHYWLLDPDEIYTPDGIAAMRKAIFENQDKEVFHTKPMHFWHDPWHYATGGIWDTRHLRVCEWRAGHHYRHHTNPCDDNGNLIHEMKPNYRPLSMHVDECVRYHYGMARMDIESVRKKIEFYAWRDKNEEPADVNDKLLWLDWYEGMDLGHVVIQRFFGEHPEPVKAVLNEYGIKQPDWRKS
jgi:glycosyltransferase involved in cell wall biosynthesis